MNPAFRPLPARFCAKWQISVSAAICRLRDAKGGVPYGFPVYPGWIFLLCGAAALVPRNMGQSARYFAISF